MATQRLRTIPRQANPTTAATPMPEKLHLGQLTPLTAYGIPLPREADTPSHMIAMVLLTDTFRIQSVRAHAQ